MVYHNDEDSLEPISWAALEDWASGQQLPESDGFMNIPEGADEELPFN
jgi:hypothetical protein